MEEEIEEAIIPATSTNTTVDPAVVTEVIPKVVEETKVEEVTPSPVVEEVEEEATTVTEPVAETTDQSTIPPTQEEAPVVEENNRDIDLPKEETKKHIEDISDSSSKKTITRTKEPNIVKIKEVTTTIREIDLDRVLIEKSHNEIAVSEIKSKIEELQNTSCNELVRYLVDKEIQELNGMLEYHENSLKDINKILESVE